MLLRRIVLDRFLDRFGKKGDLRRAQEVKGRGKQTGAVKRHSREMWETDDPLSLSVRAVDPFVLDTMTSPRSFFTCHQGYAAFVYTSGTGKEGGRGRLTSVVTVSAKRRDR